MPKRSEFGKRVDGPAGRRRAQRDAVQVAVSLYSIEQSRVVLVTDISTTGCRIRGVALPEVGCEVLLKSTDADFFGTVKWADDVDRGIAFDQPIDPEMLQKLKQEESWQLHQSLKGER